MFDLSRLSVRREFLAWRALDDAAEAKEMRAFYEDGTADFRDLRYAEDRAYDSALALLAFDQGLCALILATEA